MDFLTLLSYLAKIIEYTPKAYSTIKEIVAVWEEQTGEAVTDEQWASIDDLLKTPASYFTSRTSDDSDSE